MQIPIRTSLARSLMAALVVIAATSGGAIPASAAPPRQHEAGLTVAAGAAHALKPVPTPPANAYRPGAGLRVAAKPARRSSAMAPMATWTVSLATSTSRLWPTQYATLTATANQDVGPTPYYIDIFDVYGNGTPLVTCPSGTTCSVSVTQPNPQFHYYEAFVSGYPSSFPPPNMQADSGWVGVEWRGVNLSLSVDRPTLPVGSTVTLTSTTSEDIGPSPFYAEIFDTTAGARLAVCGFGTTCTATAMQMGATTHHFIAFVSGYSATFPPAQVQTVSGPGWVTWSDSVMTAWQVSLTSVPWPTATVTATVNQDVAMTPYSIEIFAEYDDQNGVATTSRIAVCHPGTTCTVSPQPGVWVVAFVSLPDTAAPPSGTLASSNVVPSPDVII